MGCRLTPRYMGGSTLFNGTTSTIPTTLTSNDVFKTGNGFTMWRWIKVKDYGESGIDAGRIFDKSDDTNATNGIKWQLLNTGVFFVRINNGTGISSANRSVKLKRWVLALVTIEANATVTHYVDGVASGTPATTSAISTITTENPLTIGNRSGGTDHTFDGLMGEGGIVPRVITQAEITALYTHGSIPADTAHFWKLDDQPSTYVDTIGGATGTGTATTWSPDVPVQLRTAIDEEARSSLSFDGNDYVEIYGDTANPLSSSITNEVTLFATINTNQSGASGNVVRCRDNILMQIVTSNGITGRISINNSLQETLSGTILPRNKWVNVAYTYKAGIQKLYVEGKLVAQSTILNGTVTTGTSWTIGNRYNGTEFLIGKLKKAGVLNTALTDQQIRDLHFNNIVPTTGLVLDLPLNEGAGTIAYDQSGNGNNGTISGATWCACTPTKKRTLVGENLVKNGDFSYVPVVNVAQTQTGWIDGTETGGVTAKSLFRWYFSENNSASSAMYDTSVLYNGKPTLKVSTLDATGTARISQTTITGGSAENVLNIPNLINVKPSTEYRFSCYAKTNNVATNAVLAYIKKLTGSLAATEETTNRLTGTNDWTLLSKTFTTGSDTAYIRIELFNGVAGNISDAWFADIKLQETTPPTRTSATGRVNITC